MMAQSTSSRYIRVETAISVGINSVLSAVAFLIVFGAEGPVPIWGAGGLVLDGLPQGFMIALMGTLVPGLLTARRLRSGTVEPVPAISDSLAARLPKNLVALALTLAVVTALVGTAVFALACLLTARAQVESWTLALIVKIAFGAILALVVTPIGLRAALARPLRHS